MSAIKYNIGGRVRPRFRIVQGNVYPWALQGTGGATPSRRDAGLPASQNELVFSRGRKKQCFPLALLWNRRDYAPDADQGQLDAQARPRQPPHGPLMPNYTTQCKTCGMETVIFRNLMDFGRWPRCCGVVMEQVIKPTQVVRDIEPYMAIATDVATGKPPRIGSRREHREFLKRNGYVEVGNSVPEASLKTDRNMSPGMRSSVRLRKSAPKEGHDGRPRRIDITAR